MDHLNSLRSYGGGKWGRYVRAPELYFELMKEFGARFVPLGELVDILYGLKSGCDAFFLPKDVSDAVLTECPEERGFRKRFGVSREFVSNGTLRIIETGNGIKHPLEGQFLKPEVHSLMSIDRPEVYASEVKRVVLLVDKPLKDLKGTYVGNYLAYGATHQFPSKKSKPVPVPKRPSCASRSVWYDLTGLVRPSFAFWPKATQYRPMVVFNPENLIASCRLYYLTPRLAGYDQEVMTAILNSTVVGFWRNFYGRYTGTEGSLDTMIVDVNLLEVPDPRCANSAVSKGILEAFRSMRRRSIGQFVAEDLMNCHSTERARELSNIGVFPDEFLQEDRRQLDNYVFQLLGVEDEKRRKELRQRLYGEAAEYFRRIRITEIEKMEQRSGSGGSTRYTIEELASDIWDALEESNRQPFNEWWTKQISIGKKVTIPLERPALLASEQHMFDSQRVYYGKDRKIFSDFSSRAETELIAFLATIGLSGDINVPDNEEKCRAMLPIAARRYSDAKTKIEDLTANRIGNEELREDVLGLLSRWCALGPPILQK